MYDKQALIDLVRERALKFGNFTLASGKKASYYLDGKQVTLDSAGARLVAEGILDVLGTPLPVAVGGMAIGADPITAAVITMAGVRGVPLRASWSARRPRGTAPIATSKDRCTPGDDGGRLSRTWSPPAAHRSRRSSASKPSA